MTLIKASLFCTPSAPVRHKRFHRVFECLPDNPEFLWIAFEESSRVRFCLGKRDVRWERRHIWIGVSLEYAGPIGSERLVPGIGNLLRLIHENPAQSEHIGVMRIGEVRNILRRIELGIARQSTLLPGYLIQIAIVQNEHN